MSNFKRILFLFLISFAGLSVAEAQESGAALQRTAEQEATKQTEKLRHELQLTTEQYRIIYEINLKYEHQRQVSNTRMQAMERIKNKNAEIERVLSEGQKNALQNKRYDPTTTERSYGRTRSEALMPQNVRATGPNQFQRSGGVVMRDATPPNTYRGNTSGRSAAPQGSNTNSKSMGAPRTPQKTNSTNRR